MARREVVRVACRPEVRQHLLLGRDNLVPLGLHLLTHLRLPLGRPFLFLGAQLLLAHTQPLELLERHVVLAALARHLHLDNVRTREAAFR